MKNIEIKISEKFTDSPGARYYSDGDYSGQEFFLEYLVPAFEEAVEKDCKLVINLDDTWGYASSFISGAFGCLSKEYGREKVNKTLKLISDDEPDLKIKIQKEIENPRIKDKKDCFEREE